MAFENIKEFDQLHRAENIIWMGQNTNHLPAHPKVKESLLRGIHDQSFNLYAPPYGLEELRELVLNDLRGNNSRKEAQVLITDGAIAGLYLVCKRFANSQTSVVTSDPTWVWPLKFSLHEGASIRCIPVYDKWSGFKLKAEVLDAEFSKYENSILYLVDPLNPLGSCYERNELKEIAEVAKTHDVLIVHDCTYRDFAFEHHLVRDFYPQKTITTYSFSKWLGIAGLRTGAIIADDPIFSYLLEDQANTLGSNILGQKAAIAAFKIKDEWISHINKIQRGNQNLIQTCVEALSVLNTLIFPSNGNFLAIACLEQKISANAVARAFMKRGIFIRTSDYHSDVFRDDFLKISTTVPEAWVIKLCNELPSIVDECLSEK